ncbi:histidine kinase [Streptomyces sp. NPDC049954]|uniref:sensor histidine kinase n=1 Tax=Streptomyces sp. NPDC049954 TaxID=3155779 RepID=UPI0034193972
MLGSFTAVVELAFVVLSGCAVLAVQTWPSGRRALLARVFSGARRLVEVERIRLSLYMRAPSAGMYEDGRAFAYLAARWPLGILGAFVLVGVFAGLLIGTLFLYIWFLTDVRYPGDVIRTSLLGLLLLFMALQGLIGVKTLEQRLARRLLGPGQQEQLKRRIDQLFSSRAGVVEAVHEERRRIERDLHDGVQQRLVALGILVGRALRSEEPERMRELLMQAHAESREALVDLREVAWRVYPQALDESGLRTALETVAERAAIPVSVECRVRGEPPQAVATAVYFVVSEAVTNAVKYSAAHRIRVRVDEQPSRVIRSDAGDRGMALLVTVEDNGKGGANPHGGGLIGLAQRVAALDGSLDVCSPVGGPTIITAEVPCD